MKTDAPLLTAVSDLAREIGTRWRAKGEAIEAFAETASGPLAAMPAVPFDMDEVLSRVASHEGLVQRSGRVFSDAPAVIHQEPGFAIELLVWTDATPIIHGHSIRGAFRVLAGSILHAVYSFTEEQAVDAEVRLGTVRLTRLENLRTGDTRQIRTGPAGLHHRTLHIDRPTVTLLVRNRAELAGERHFSLHPPGLAVELDSHTRDPTVETLVRLLAAARATDAAAPSRFLRGPALELCPKRFVRLTQALSADTEWNLTTDPHGWTRSTERRLGHAGALAWRAAHDEERRTVQLLALRSRTRDPNVRFALAAAACATSAAEALDVAAKRVPDTDPARLLGRGLADAARMRLPPGAPGAGLCRALNAALEPHPEPETALTAFLRARGGAAGDAGSLDAGTLARLCAIPELRRLAR